MRAALLALALFLPWAAQAADDKPSADKPPTVYFALIAMPGPHWNPSLKFQEQPGIGDHVSYLKRLMEQGDLLMAGPFLDGSGELAILSVDGIDTAKLIAAGDPAAGSGLLTLSVKPWLIGLAKE
jgi:uncharacterized protein YciI